MTMSQAAATFRLEREFDAPITQIWNAFTDPVHLVEWFGPVGLGLEVEEFSAMPGGIFHYAMVPPSGEPFYGAWTFQTLEAPTRLVHLIAFTDAQAKPIRHPMAPVWPLFMQAEVLLTDKDGKTGFQLILNPWEAAPEEIEAFKAGHESMTQGFEGTYAQLDAYLKTMVA
jgi:uncharacterized protein YndB with AHSA1/START domain